jgi:hypothetical protein
MNGSIRHEAARHTRIQDFGKAKRRPSFYKKALVAVSYVTASAIVALGMAYWPAAAGGVLGKLNITPTYLMSASDVPNRIHKTDRFSGISFQERWSAVPVHAAETPGNESQREQPQAERRSEKIPFGCESAFGRLVTKGNFSTRCIAGLETSKLGGLS